MLSIFNLKSVFLIVLLGLILMGSSLLSVKLITQHGIVSELVTNVEEHIDHDPLDTNLRFLPPRKVYAAKFSLGGNPIEAKFQMPFEIANSEELKIAGYEKSGVFNVLAFRNHSNEIVSNSWKVAIAAGIGFSVISLLILLKLINDQSMIFPKILMAIFIGVGLYLARYGSLIKQARELL